MNRKSYQNIYLVKMVYDSTNTNYEYEILAKPHSPSKFSEADCPTRQQFTEAELWQIHFWPIDDLASIMKSIIQ